MLLSLVLLIQFPATGTLRYHLVDATSKKTSWDLMLRYVAFSCTSYTISSYWYFKISLSWCYVTRTSLDFMLRYVAFSCTSYTTSSYDKISLGWCYVTRTSLDFMLRYVAFSCTSYTISSYWYVKISLSWCYVKKDFLRPHATLCCFFLYFLYNFQLLVL